MAPSSGPFLHISTFRAVFTEQLVPHNGIGTRIGNGCFSKESGSESGPVLKFWNRSESESVSDMRGTALVETIYLAFQTSAAQITAKYKVVAAVGRYKQLKQFKKCLLKAPVLFVPTATFRPRPKPLAQTRLRPGAIYLSMILWSWPHLAHVVCTPVGHSP